MCRDGLRKTPEGVPDALVSDCLIELDKRSGANYIGV
jgi:hypothetical protein